MFKQTGCAVLLRLIVVWVWTLNDRFRSATKRDERTRWSRWRSTISLTLTNRNTCSTRSGPWSTLAPSSSLGTISPSVCYFFYQIQVNDWNSAGNFTKNICYELPTDLRSRLIALRCWNEPIVGATIALKLNVIRYHWMNVSLPHCGCLTTEFVSSVDGAVWLVSGGANERSSNSAQIRRQRIRQIWDTYVYRTLAMTESW